MQSTQITAGGNLILRVIEGRLFRDTEVFGKMDPYVILSLNDKKFKTRVHNNGGKNPKWEDEF